MLTGYLGKRVSERKPQFVVNNYIVLIYWHPLGGFGGNLKIYRITVLDDQHRTLLVRHYTSKQKVRMALIQLMKEEGVPSSKQIIIEGELKDISKHQVWIPRESRFHRFVQFEIEPIMVW